MPQPLCASPASEACRLVAEIDSCINAAFAPLPPSSQLQDLALRVGRAGQLEVSSLRHRHSHTAGPVFRLSVHGIFQARVLEWGAIAFSESIY